MTVESFKERIGYEVAGVWLPRVTAITSSIDKPYAIPGLAEYAAWGSAIHEAAGCVILGQDVSVDDRMRPAVEAFQYWLSHNPIKIDGAKDIERLLVDRNNGYAGTADLIGEIDGKRGIVDIKTGTTIRKEYALQTAAYMNAYNYLNPDTPAFTRWIMRIDQYDECMGCEAKKRSRTRRDVISGGKAGCNHQWGGVRGEVVILELEDFQDDLEAFFEAKDLWEVRSKHMLSRIPNYSRYTSVDI